MESHPNRAILVVKTSYSILKADYFDLVYFYSTFLVKCVKGRVDSVNLKTQCYID